MSNIRKTLFDALAGYNINIPVFNKEDLVVTPETSPTKNKVYAVIWEEGSSLKSSSQGDYNFRVAVHYPPGYIDEIDNYLSGLSLLLKDPVEYETSGKFYTFSPGETSDMAFNDDNTISKDRILTLPAWG